MEEVIVLGMELKSIFWWVIFADFFFIRLVVFVVRNKETGAHGSRTQSVMMKSLLGYLMRPRPALCYVYKHVAVLFCDSSIKENIRFFLFHQLLFLPFDRLQTTFW